MTEHKEAYLIYLNSPEWKAKREQILKRRGNKCRACKSTENLHLHHITYARLGFELPKDLVILCKICHEKVHLLGGGRKGLNRLINPKKVAKRKERNKRKSFVAKMLSGPVKVYTPDGIASYQGA